LALEAIANANNERIMLMPLKASGVIGAVAGVAGGMKAGRGAAQDNRLLGAAAGCRAHGHPRSHHRSLAGA
jgi:hypothetical protein